MLDVALEIPLATLLIGGCLQIHHKGATRIQLFHEELDVSNLAGGIKTIEQDDYALAGLLDPVLHLQELYLQRLVLLFILLAFHLLRIGILCIGEYIFLAQAADLLAGGQFLGCPVCCQF